MKLRLGPPPQADDFLPDEEGWNAIFEPSPVLMQFMALPVAFVGVAVTAAAVIFLTPVSLEKAPGLGILVVLVAIVPVHEMLHTLGHARLGLDGRTVLGVWPRRGMFYAHYDGIESRSRFLLSFAMPTLVLTVLPVLAAAVFRLSWWGFGIVPLVNAAFSCGDGVGFVLVLSQIPRGAQVRNKGWRSYWREGGG
jgi:hypothetical protein